MAQGGELSLGQVLRLRVRHMSDGVALGTRAFVNEVFTLHREKFGPRTQGRGAADPGVVVDWADGVARLAGAGVGLGDYNLRVASLFIEIPIWR